ncbi:MAG: 6-phosphofructokinase [Deltaproteobacteria bacterium]|nr:6-phosphofructokinase [Deltaproteobacteria bacterium]
MKTFISYNFEDEKFVRLVNYYLKKQSGLTTYCYSADEALQQKIERQIGKDNDLSEETALNIFKDEIWREKIGSKIRNCAKFVFFVGPEIGNTQMLEALAFIRKFEKVKIDKIAAIVKLPEAGNIPDVLFQFAGHPKPVKAKNTYHPEENGKHAINYESAIHCAKDITDRLLGKNKWIESDGLPIGYPFDYEKDIIQEYIDGRGWLESPIKLEQGCSEKWPEVQKIKAHEEAELQQNPILEDVIGDYRPEDAKIIVDARSKYHCWTNNVDVPICLNALSLSFPEAGPRKKLIYPRKETLTVAILVSGGIAPGINAVITGIVERHCLYRNKSIEKKQPYTLQMYGYRDGFKGLLRGDYIPLIEEENNESVMIKILKGLSNQGGSFLGTSRYDPLMDFDHPAKRDSSLNRIVRKLADNVDILYIIGGDGSMRASHMIYTRMLKLKEKRVIDRKFSVVAIPKTMDNDILWAWQSFGFMSAVEKAKEFILQLYTEASSNPRLCIMQLFGSDSGFVVSHAALASGVCDAVLIPETDFSMEVLSRHIKDRLKERYKPGQQGKSPYGMILLAETAIPRNSEDDDKCRYLDDTNVRLGEGERKAINKFISNGRRVQGQTPDATWHQIRSKSGKISEYLLTNPDILFEQ